MLGLGRGRLWGSVAMLAACLGCGRVHFDQLPRDGGLGGGDSGSRIVIVEDLMVSWATPNVIRWQWTLGGALDELDHFELAVGTSAAEAVDRTGSVRIIAAPENPELAFARRPRTGAMDPVVDTMTFDHLPGTTYFAVLSAVHRAGTVSSTNVASTTTQVEALREVVIIRDADTAGYSIPGTFVYSTTAPYAGTHHYEYSAPCSAPASACFEILRRQDLAQDVSAVDAVSFDATAFVEFALAAEGPEDSHWSEVRVMMGPAASRGLYIHSGFSVRADGNYRVYQIPLRALQSGGVTMPFAVMADPMFEFGVGALWSSDGFVRMDEVRLRW